MSHQWFVLRNGKEQGPFNAQQLKSFAKAGKLHTDDLIRRDDMKSPIQAHQIKGLFDMPSAAASQSSEKPLTEPPKTDEVVQKPTTSNEPTTSQEARIIAGILGSVVGFVMSFFMSSSKLITTFVGFVLAYVLQMLSEPAPGENQPVQINGRVITSAVPILLFLAGWFGWLGTSTGAFSDSKMRDFGDNPQNYKGSTVTLKLDYEGSGLGGWIEKGKISNDLDVPFKALGIVGTSTFRFMVNAQIKAGLKVPSLNSGDEVIVKFKCTEGSLEDGNEVISITRP
jgi:hypothetical protein